MIRRRAAGVSFALLVGVFLPGCAAGNDNTVACDLFFSAYDEQYALGKEVLAVDGVVSRELAESYVAADAATRNAASLASERATDSDLIVAFDKLAGHGMNDDEATRVAAALTRQNAAVRCRELGGSVTYDVRDSAD